LDFSDFYLFLTVKKLERIQLADEDHFFWVSASDFEWHWSTRIKERISGLSGASSRSKPKQWRLRQMITNFDQGYFCSISSERAGACAYVPGDISKMTNAAQSFTFRWLDIFNLHKRTIYWWERRQPGKRFAATENKIHRSKKRIARNERSI
jgi:hypothetical protein